MTRPTRKPRARRSPAARSLAPALVFFVGITATLAAWEVDSRRTDEQVLASLNGAADAFTDGLANELDRYADAARSMRTLFDGGPLPDDERYARAAELLELDQRYPAITGLNALLPAGPALQGSWTIQYVAPRGPNRAALGFNIRDNPLAEEAALAAAESGLPVMTKPITLAQETGDALGFVIYVPFYDTQASLGSVQQRRDGHRGWTQAVFRAPDIIAAVGPAAPGVSIEITTEGADGTDALVASMAGTAEPTMLTRRINRFGRMWDLHFTATPAYVTLGSRSVGQQILLMGIPVTLLLSGLVLALARSDRRATALVQERTAELRQREQRFRTLTSTSPTGTFELDASGAPSYANAQLTSMLGWTANDERANWRETMHDDDVVLFENAWQELLTRDRPVAVRVRVHGPDAGLHHVRIRIVPLHDNHRRIGFIGTVEDLSAEVAAQVRAEQALTQARERAADLAAVNEQLEQTNADLHRTVAERDELTAIVAHDVRAPLTVIGGFAETIAKIDGPRLSEVSRDFLKRITRQTNELEALVDDLVLGGRLGAGAVRAEPGLVNTADLAAELAQDLIADDVAVDTTGPATVRADPRHVRRVLANLLSNARKYGRAPFAVQIRGGPERVAISVIDHGPGVPPDMARRLFQRFAGGDAADVEPGSGAGLGLSIVADLVDLNGGTVRYSAVEPTGACFTVEFPASAVDRRSTQQPPLT